MAERYPRRQAGLTFLLVLSLISYSKAADNQDTIPIPATQNPLEKLSLGGYGAANYYNFNWQTDSSKRDAIDQEFLVLELKYNWTDKIRLNAEIEFEHGGTGAAIEFDRFEEYGEFEYEISKGGEVFVEEMNLEFDVWKKSRFQAGRVKVPFGSSFNRNEPTDYLTATFSEMEATILPQNWTENGISFSTLLGKKNIWTFYLSLINGLDGSAFNSANWIKRGHQKRFELVNAESFALASRLDFAPNEKIKLGVSVYGGNTTGNRPKPDLPVDTPLGIADFHYHQETSWAEINAMFFYGALGNSEALTIQNRNLSNNLNVKRTPVAAAAIGGFAEIAFPVIKGDPLSAIPKKRMGLTVY
ncbi:MAG TPA: hypothetical protein VFV79_04720, partial [Saprospiraceae bacterium]|nr:hypothetical protein [Saprospiraceae bacterium]